MRQFGSQLWLKADWRVNSAIPGGWKHGSLRAPASSGARRHRRSVHSLPQPHAKRAARGGCSIGSASAATPRRRPPRRLFRTLKVASSGARHGLAVEPQLAEAAQAFVGEPFGVVKRAPQRPRRDRRGRASARRASRRGRRSGCRRGEHGRVVGGGGRAAAEARVAACAAAVGARAPRRKYSRPSRPVDVVGGGCADAHPSWLSASRAAHGGAVAHAHARVRGAPGLQPTAAAWVPTTADPRGAARARSAAGARQAREVGVGPAGGHGGGQRREERPLAQDDAGRVSRDATSASMAGALDHGRRASSRAPIAQRERAARLASGVLRSKSAMSSPPPLSRAAKFSGGLGSEIAC